MAEQGMGRGGASGPGNKRIATTFLESLAVRGEAAAHDRATRALGMGEGGLAEAKTWLAEDVIGRMFVAASTDPSLARSVGHRLIAPDATGLPLYGLGLATPEKAYRRAQALLPRDRADSRWSIDEMGSGSAQLTYHDHAKDGEAESVSPSSRSSVGGGRGAASLCALRVGMLEAIPGLFGLLPAQVTETTCLSQGGDACRYDVRWEQNSRSGLTIGGSAGLGFAIGFVGAALAAGPAVFPLSAGVFLGMLSLGLGLTVGRCVDLHRQLEAVAGARRGHLALFDQVDDALASKLDALARADAKLEGDEFSPRGPRLAPDSETGPSTNRQSEGEIQIAVQKIHTTAGDLDCWFEETAAGMDSGEGEFEAGRAFVREIRTWTTKISDDRDPADLRSREPIDVAALVKRAVVAARPTLAGGAIVHFDADADLDPIPCEPVQIEEMVIQLLRNAAQASSGLCERPEVFATVRKMNSGVEIAIEDRGAGIEPAEIDEVFDPFFGDRCAGVDEGFGLPVCLRIVERHGGELRIEAEDRPGTRVSVLLPESFEPDR